MAIRWDPLLVAATARVLDRACRGARVRALLMQPDNRRVTLFLDGKSVLLELRPEEGWLSVLPGATPPPEARKMSAFVERVASPPDESLFAFELRGRGPDGRDSHLVVELLGNRWNALLVEAESGVVREVLNTGRGRGRGFRVGDPYTPPRATGRLGAEGSLDRTGWANALRALEGSAVERVEAGRAAILARVAWTSSLNVGFVSGADGWERWREITDPASWGSYLLEGPSGPQPYPVPLGADGARPCTDLFEAFRIAREGSGALPAPSAGSLSPTLERAIERRLERARRRVAALRRELDGAEHPEAVRALGNLILARFGEIPRGATRAQLRGFDGEPVEIELDPTLPVDRNAARYFERAARVERARKALPEKIEEAERVRDHWERVLAEARASTVPLESLASELGLEIPRRQPKGEVAAALPYRTYRSSGGLEIRVGRGAKYNDDLTFRHAAPTDIWLHVRQNPGAHVILRWSLDDRPPRKDLAEAATLAALHSPARGSSSVPVAWTRRKYVRKPRGAPPGTVAPDRTETVFVRPDPELLKRLRVEEAESA